MQAKGTKFTKGTIIGHKADLPITHVFPQHYHENSGRKHGFFTGTSAAYRAVLLDIHYNCMKLLQVPQDLCKAVRYCGFKKAILHQFTGQAPNYSFGSSSNFVIKYADAAQAAAIASA
jgi:hypothetical protein